MIILTLRIWSKLRDFLNGKVVFLIVQDDGTQLSGLTRSLEITKLRCVCSMLRRRMNYL